MATDRYDIRGVSPTDVVVALRCEADRAKSEEFDRVAERQRALALHLENAYVQMAELATHYHRTTVRMDVTFELVPDVNPVLRPEFR